MEIAQEEARSEGARSQEKPGSPRFWPLAPHHDIAEDAAFLSPQHFHHFRHSAEVIDTVPARGEMMLQILAAPPGRAPIQHIQEQFRSQAILAGSRARRTAECHAILRQHRGTPGVHRAAN